MMRSLQSVDTWDCGFEVTPSPIANSSPHASTLGSYVKLSENYTQPTLSAGVRRLRNQYSEMYAKLIYSICFLIYSIYQF